jgi:hypothetical protein
MNKRQTGRAIRKIVKLDRAWRAAGRQEGRTESDLAMFLGRAYRGGFGPAAERARRRNV